ncbi:DUF4249 family protein [Robertkochia aurantiaca]|uniref:DUF4249 family protein n=1 Tax=Robertkochia aurantiaca TaxID=2873700 RepID=UPI001CCBE42D|nr:DUF4249 family protein [Robertkochia sp. 3YJGBD-33]
MKKIFFSLLGVWLLFQSCEEVVDVDLPKTESRLVIDALIRVDTSQPDNLIRVNALETASFFEELQPARLNTISITNLNSGTAISLERSGESSSAYEAVVPKDFITNGNFLLQAEHKGRTYTATSSFFPSVPIDNLEQGNDILFEETDIEVKVRFTDDGTTDDFYLFDFDFGEYLTSRDDFYQGQQFEFSYFYEELQPGEVIRVNLLGIDQAFYNYMNQVIEQSGGDGFTPFATPVSALRGNIQSEQDTTEDFAFGYFIVSETFSDSLIVQEK